MVGYGAVAGVLSLG